ncbi:MAG: hypothetical protein D6719_06820 [Candidatus Dadabacteria bacterium]|nr:MAG: hypothetical protein D6719_06820 [Candidatus Dadabacteria bacterium]
MSKTVYRGQQIDAVLNKIRDDHGDSALILSMREQADNIIEVTVDINQHCDPRGLLLREILLETQISVTGTGEIDSLGLTPGAAQSFDRGRLVEQLINTGLSPEIIEGILEQPSLELIADDLEQLMTYGLRDQVRFDSEIDEDIRTIAFIGPKGAGKSTAASKFAAYLKEFYGLRPGLISILAVDEELSALEDLGAAYDLPTISLSEEELSPYTLKKAINTLSDCNIVIIDTPGIARVNKRDFRKIQHALTSQEALEPLLVIPGEGVELSDYAFDYLGFGYSRMVLTKLDRVFSPAAMLNVARYFGKSIAFYSASPSRTSGLREACAEDLAVMFCRKIH